jgi:N-methylhydantoinase B/oxoprolinase/acetone carboxylase alpha subunit
LDNLRTKLDQLEDARLSYVMARSRVNSDRQGFIEAGIAKATFYTWPAEERERLNNLAQQFKRETATRALIVLQDAAEEAAKVKVSGLKSRDERVKQAAATEIIDRTIGKTEQPVSGEVNIVVTLKENDRVQNTD